VTWNKSTADPMDKVDDLGWTRATAVFASILHDMDDLRLIAKNGSRTAFAMRFPQGSTTM
jgi:hypothetical protein